MLTDPLVWIDLEMTGLDVEHEVIVEVAVIVTDGQLEEVVEGPDLVVGADPGVLAAMHRRVVDLHTASGLLPLIQRETRTVGEAEAAVLAFVREHVPEPGLAPLAGNSVHADRTFLRRFMPALERHVHYRNVDVSTLKELARRWHPEVLAAAPAKHGGHRALADLRESIAELRWYREHLFR